MRTERSGANPLPSLVRRGPMTRPLKRLQTTATPATVQLRPDELQLPRSVGSGVSPTCYRLDDQPSGSLAVARSAGSCCPDINCRKACLWRCQWLMKAITDWISLPIRGAPP